MVKERRLGYSAAASPHPEESSAATPLAGDLLLFEWGACDNISALSILLWMSLLEYHWLNSNNRWKFTFLIRTKSQNKTSVQEHILAKELCGVMQVALYTWYTTQVVETQSEIPGVKKW